MNKINFIFKILFSFLLFFVASVVAPVPASAAPRIYFDPANYTSAKNTEFQVRIHIDVENKSVSGADAIIKFPSSEITVKSVSNGGFFSDFEYAQADGVLEIHGYFSSLYSSRSGNGSYAVVTLVSNKGSGDGKLTFECGNSKNGTQIIDSAGSNILSCNSLNQLSISYSESSAGEATKACGGTCTLNADCNAGFMCYQGFCRNPKCQNDVSCTCANPTVKPTIRPTLRPTPLGTPETATITEYTPLPTATSSSLPSVVDEEPIDKPDIKKVAVWVGAGLLALAAILFLTRMFRNNKKAGPPKMTPPTTEIEPPSPPPPIQPPTIPPSTDY